MEFASNEGQQCREYSIIIIIIIKAEEYRSQHEQTSAGRSYDAPSSNDAPSWIVHAQERTIKPGDGAKSATSGVIKKLTRRTYHDKGIL